MVEQERRLYTLENQKLSKSIINAYKECPFAFHKRYVEGNTELDDNYYPYQFGTDVHNLFDNFYINGETDINKLIKNIVLNEKYIKYKYIVDNFIQLNQKLKEELGQNFIPIKKEFKIKNIEKNISGVIDRVQFDGKDYLIIDYKQKGADYLDEDETLNKYRFELALYSWLFEQEMKIEVKGWGIYFAKDGKLIWEKRNQEEINKALKLIDETRENINKELKGGTINRCEKCRYCKKYEI